MPNADRNIYGNGEENRGELKMADQLSKTVKLMRK